MRLLILLLSCVTLNAYASWYTPVDGIDHLTAYSPAGFGISTNANYIVEEAQPPDSNTTPRSKPITCTVTSTYNGDYGVKIEISGHHFIPYVDGSPFNNGHDLYVSIKKPITFQITGRILKDDEHFDGGYLYINNNGCLAERDGINCQASNDAHKTFATINCKYN